jgi:SAM-dependent methyltransferase
LNDSPWNRPETVAGFTATPPNADLLRYAAAVWASSERRLAVDIGCGAARNAIPLAQQGWNVIGTDLSMPMLAAASRRASELRLASRLHLLRAPMQRLPIADASADLIVAHGIWNLARSDAEFRLAVREAARVARPQAGLFVFTFSRTTLAIDAVPVAGESFVFTEFSGGRQIFLTEDQLIDELGDAGFVPDPVRPLRELNRPSAGLPIAGGPPVIYQGAFRLPRSPREVSHPRRS